MLCCTASEAATRQFFHIFALSTVRKSDFSGDVSTKMWEIIWKHTKLLTAAHVGPGFDDYILLVEALSKCQTLKSFRYYTLIL